MEKLWNLLYYFLYKLDFKSRVLYMKIDPSLFIARKTKFGINYFKRRGYDPAETFLESFRNPYYGLSYTFAGIYLIFAFLPPGLPLMSLYRYCYIKIFGNPVLSLPGLLVFLGWGAIIYILNERCLLHKDKYLKYFRLFDMQTHKWKVKWAWISAGILIMPLLITILTIKFAKL